MARSEQARTSRSTLLRHHRSAVGFLSITSLASGTSEALFLVLVTKTGFAITDDSSAVEIAGGRSLSVNQALLVGLALVAVRMALAVLSTWQSARLSATVTAEVRRRLASAFLRANWATQQQDSGGKLQELLTTFAGAGANLVGSITSSIVAACNLAALLAISVFVDPASSIIVIVAVVALATALRPIRRAVGRQAERVSADGMQFATALNETSQLGMEMHVFNVQPQTDARVQGLIASNASVSERLFLIRGLLPVLYSGLAYFVLVGGLALVVASDSADVTVLGAVMLLLLRSLSYGQALQSSAAAAISSMPFIDALNAEVRRYEEAAVVDRGSAIGSLGPICLSDVSFGYADDELVLEGIDAYIEPREIVGIVGPSGSGKSTLVQLLLGLRHPTTGSVLADGRDIEQLSRSEWARTVTFVPQSPRLIVGSIADNIRFMRDDISDEDVERASRLACLHDDVVGWKDGYNRLIGEAGGQLSGGQQQRLCIARALVEKPDLIILDEPTSALDVRSESLIRETLAGLRERMAVVVIAHRMSTLDICDRIMVIQDGRLTAFDTPENLRSSSEFYREALELSGLQ